MHEKASNSVDGARLWPFETLAEFARVGENPYVILHPAAFGPKMAQNFHFFLDIREDGGVNMPEDQDEWDNSPQSILGGLRKTNVIG
jgi:hypothetical protein